MMSATSHLEVRVEQGVMVLSIKDREVQGEEIANQLRTEMLAALEQTHSIHVVVDFARTEYISSAAFWPLLSLFRKLREANGRMTVCGLSPTVGDVFFTTRLASRDGSVAAPFGVENDVPAAIARLLQPSPELSL